eukprot:1850764-Pleurochrysis_carterae.AAC.1
MLRFRDATHVPKIPKSYVFANFKVPACFNLNASGKFLLATLGKACVLFTMVTFFLAGNPCIKSADRFPPSSPERRFITACRFECCRWHLDSDLVRSAVRHGRRGQRRRTSAATTHERSSSKPTCAHEPKRSLLRG